AGLRPARREHAALVRAVCHLVYPLGVAPAQAVPGIDVTVRGHSHTQLDEPVVVGDTIIVQANEYGKYVGFLKLVVDGGRIVDYEGRLLPTTADMPIDAAVAASLADWQGQLSERLGVVIGETAVDLDGERGNVRTKETNLGNLVA